MELNNIEIKGPFSYSGNKYRIYKAYLSEVMSKFENTHELFLGSGACIYNSKIGGIGIDIDANVIALHNSLHDDKLLSKIKDTYNLYFPNGRDKDAYMNLRKDFNKLFVKNGTNSTNVHMLHLLIQLSFNSLLRFSKNGYNVPFGMKEIDINRIESHQKVIKSRNIKFINGSYSSINLDEVDKEKDLIYLDPPYIASKFQYGGWNKEDEISLLNYIDTLNEDGYKFILSNTFKHRNVINQDLINWSSKYNVKYINMSYNSWSAAVKSVKNEKETNEVIISNFIF
jgi:DNA adenine methylase Dam